MFRRHRLLLMTAVSVLLVLPVLAAASVLLIETSDTDIDRALSDLGQPFARFTGTDFSAVDMSSYDHVFVAINGGNILEPSIANAAAYAAAGGSLHFYGGSALAGFVTAVDAHLVGCSTTEYSWEFPVGETLVVERPEHYLARDLPANHTYAYLYANNYMIRVADPAAQVAASSGDGHEMLFSKRIGAGIFDMCANPPSEGFYDDAGDYAVLKQIVENMLAADPAPAEALLIAYHVSAIKGALADLGVSYETWTSLDFSSIDLSDYAHVFVSLNGGSVTEPSIVNAADYAAAGGALHFYGGTAWSTYVAAVNAHLIGCDTVDYMWTDPVGDDFEVDLPLHYLGRNLPAIHNYANFIAAKYHLRITDPQAEVVARTGDGHPVLVAKSLGAGTFDFCGSPPDVGYLTDPDDMALLKGIVANMIAGEAGRPEVVVFEFFPTYIDEALADLGVPFDRVGDFDFENHDLDLYPHVFVGLNGGLPDDDDMASLEDFTRAGGNLHMLGGSGLEIFADGVDGHLFDIDETDFSWIQAYGSPDLATVDAAHFLAQGLPASLDFAFLSATYYMLRVVDPDIHVAAVTDVGLPALFTKYLGDGRLDVFVYSPGEDHYADPGDYAVGRQIVRNMLAGGPPRILSVADVPGDQGGRVRVRWRRSPMDAYNQPVTITGYALWRRADGIAPRTAPAPGAPDRPELFPQGDWDYVATVQARGEEEYGYVAPTVCDSTAAGVCWSAFFVSALTAHPLVFFDSPVDSGYSADNLAPGVPEGLVVAYAAGGNALEWLESEDADFRYFKVYIGSAPDFTVDPENPAFETATPGWTDPAGGFDVFYKVSAVDFAGNESEAAIPAALTDVDGPSRRFALHGAVPNPFNPKTTIAFSLPRSADVTLRVYDLSGRLVATLLDGSPHGQGRHEAVWDGRDDRGRAAAAGGYIARLEADGRIATTRMMLVK